MGASYLITTVIRAFIMVVAYYDLINLMETTGRVGLLSLVWMGSLLLKRIAWLQLLKNCLTLT